MVANRRIRRQLDNARYDRQETEAQKGGHSIPSGPFHPAVSPLLILKSPGRNGTNGRYRHAGPGTAKFGAPQTDVRGRSPPTHSPLSHAVCQRSDAAIEPLHQLPRRGKLPGYSGSTPSTSNAPIVGFDLPQRIALSIAGFTHSQRNHYSSLNFIIYSALFKLFEETQIVFEEPERSVTAVTQHSQTS